MESLRVLLVTTWGTACGIAEHAKYLVEAVQGVDPAINFTPSQEALDPRQVLNHAAEYGYPDYDLVVLNYHAALHSRWRPEEIRELQEHGVPVLVTYHDTGVPNSDQCKDVQETANATVIHEPAEDLPGAIYWRQGVPAARGPWVWGDDLKAYHQQPILGTVGFPFPWKNYDLLAAASAAAGWALLLLAPGATESQIAAWRLLNPAMLVMADFVPAEAVVAYLGGCDATAFIYACCNTGTSGAIRQGIAARQPVLANRDCRQFRDLDLDTLGRSAIVWTPPTLDGIVTQLARLPLGRVSAASVALAAQDSWVGLGRKYAALYREVVKVGAGGRVTEGGV